MVEGAGIAHGRARRAAPGAAFVRRIHQVHHRDIAQIEPMAPERKIRARAFGEADQFNIEVARTYELGTPDGDVLKG